MCAARGPLRTWADQFCADKADFPVDFGIPALASVILSAASSPSSPSFSAISADDAVDRLDTDIELLTISASLLEGIVQNSDDAKAAIAFSTFDASLPYPQSTLLHHLLDFITTARPPSHWSSVSDDPARTEKAFSTVKAAVVRAVVETPNSDEVMERLWKETRGGKGGAGSEKSWLVEELARWLEDVQDGREDMLICAAHMLAGLGRRGGWPKALMSDQAIPTHALTCFLLRRPRRTHSLARSRLSPCRSSRSHRS